MRKTKKITHKVRTQRVKHSGTSLKTNKRKGHRKAPAQSKKTFPVIEKLNPPNHDRLLKTLAKLEVIKPWQVFEVNLFQVEVKVTKGGKEKSAAIVYFDNVSYAQINKRTYDGRSRGMTPKSVVVHSHLEAPLVPGFYSLKNVVCRADGKSGRLILLKTPQTMWQKVAV